ncbi:MAG: AAA family ATPase [Propionicimonas sp.]|nr:AAA family ATPase [Propionicimonas sp.]
MTGWTPPALPAHWTWTADLPPWVGRRDELKDLEAAWDAVERGGVRQFVLIAGEAGTGKSRLVLEVATALRSRGVPVLVGQCSAEFGLPFDPLVSPVRSLLAAVEREELALPDTPDLSGADAREFLSQFTAGRHSDGAGAAGQTVAALTAVVSALSVATAGGPLVVVLEDLHWAGESALRALRYLVERTADLPLYFLATHRDSPPDSTELLASVTSELRRLPGVRRIDLAGLTAPEVSAFLAGLGAGDGSHLTTAAEMLHESTGGNAFLLGEVWRELRGHGGVDALVGGRVPVPSSLQALVRSRLGRLAEGDREAVRRGAVIGETFDVRLVQASGGASSLAAGYRALDAAAAAGLVLPVPRDLGRYRFPHALARQALLEDMTPFALASAHAEVGQALERGGDVQDPATLLQLAHHFARAAGPDTAVRAVHYLEEAAGVAMNRLANSDAAALLQQAASLAAGEDERSRLALRAAGCHLHSGRFDQARAIYEQLAVGGSPPIRLEAAIGFEEASWRTGASVYRAVELLKGQLRRDASDELPAGRVLGTASLGRALALSGQLAEGEQVLEESVRLARELGDPRVLLEVLRHSIVSVNVRGDDGTTRFARQHERAIEALSLARACEDLDGQGMAAQNCAQAAYVFADPEELRSGLAAVARVAAVTRDPFWHWRTQLYAATIHILRCEFAAAGECLAESRRLAPSFGQSWQEMDGPWSLQSFALRREIGGLEFARAILDGRPAPSDAWLPGLVAMYCELGLVEQARAGLDRAVATGFATLRASMTWPASLALLAEAATALGHKRAADALLPELDPLSGLNLMAAELLAGFGSADRQAAGLLGVLGRSGVEERFGAALELDTRMGSTLHVATTHAEWATWLRRSNAAGRRVDEHVVPARRLAERHGLVRVHRLLRSGERSPGAPDPGLLTDRELQVLRLIGRGHSNREIASRLFISEHTAANHVRSILMKTGVANRTAATHYARRRGLLGEESDDSGE